MSFRQKIFASVQNHMTGFNVIQIYKCICSNFCFIYCEPSVIHCSFIVQLISDTGQIFFMISMCVRVECVVAYTILLIKKAIISDVKA